MAAADDLLGQVRALRSKAMSILLAAERQGDLRTALAGIREARACLELLHRRWPWPTAPGPAAPGDPSGLGLRLGR